MRSTTAAAVAVLALLLSACGADDPTVPEVEDDPVGAPDDDATEDGASEDGAGDETDAAADGATDGDATDGGGGIDDLDAATEAAREDLAASEGVDPADVEVVEAGPVTWSDGSLGCPEEGMMYTQALVPGYRILLALDGAEVAYHGADDAPPARCDDPQPPSDAAS